MEKGSRVSSSRQRVVVQSHKTRVSNVLPCAATVQQENPELGGQVIDQSYGRTVSAKHSLRRQHIPSCSLKEVWEEQDIQA